MSACGPATLAPALLMSDVDLSAERLECVCGQRLRRARHGQVGVHHCRPWMACGRNLGGDVVKQLPPARSEHLYRALSRQLDGQRPADAARCTGQQHAFALQVQPSSPHDTTLAY